MTRKHRDRIDDDRYIVSLSPRVFLDVLCVLLILGGIVLLFFGIYQAYLAYEKESNDLSNFVNSEYTASDAKEYDREAKETDSMRSSAYLIIGSALTVLLIGNIVFIVKTNYYVNKHDECKKDALEEERQKEEASDGE